MTTRTKWIVGAAAAAVVVLLVAIFSRNIVNALQNLLVDVMIYLIVFGAGWAVGYFAGRRSRDPQKPAERPRG